MCVCLYIHPSYTIHVHVHVQVCVFVAESMCVVMSDLVSVGRGRVELATCIMTYESVCNHWIGINHSTALPFLSGLYPIAILGKNFWKVELQSSAL